MAASSAPTTIEEERAIQQKWVMRKPVQGRTAFDMMLENEFRCIAETQSDVSNALADVVRFARKHVPFYREQWSERSPVRGIEDFSELPVMTRNELADAFEILRSEIIHPQAPPIAVVSTTGTSGPPVRVLHGKGSRQWICAAYQRQARWFRQEPKGLFAKIRLAEQLGTGPDGKKLADGETARLPAWSLIGHFFETGPEVHFCATNPIDAQLDWIRAQNPTYLMTFPGLMEELALANACRPICESLRSMVGVSSLMTPGMRDRIEKAFGIPIDQNYGLNEVGIIAARCRSGRYHAHVEMCHIEILDDDDRPVAPGETGRIVVTALQNRVMPVIRYDTGDLAKAVDGPCPCGRTLPSFADVVGRYRRFAYTPDGTRPRLNGLLHAIQHMEPELLRNLEQYQIRQRKGERFDLYIKTRGKLAEGFYEHLRQAWAELNSDGPVWALNFVEVDDVGRSGAGKVLDFFSDYYPNAQEGARIDLSE